MTNTEQRTLFAFDCGATNWRLYRSQYEILGNQASLVGEPSPSPLTSFSDRRLPAALMLSPDGTRLECYGENAQSQIEEEANRPRIRDYFKPCIGAHLEQNPQPHQLRFTHKQALDYTRLMLEAVLSQLLKEKWRTGSFDERILFTFAYPVHWQTDHDGVIFKDFSEMVRGCFPDEIHENIRFVSEPEGAILSLQRQGHLKHLPSGKTTLIFDVGGSTTDLVAGEIDPSSGELIFAGRYGEAFGGGLYDAEIAKSISDELLIPASVIADDPSALLSLRMVANRLKESLSRQLLFDQNTTQIPQRTVTLVTRNGEIYRGAVKLDQSRFEKLTKNLAEKFKSLIEVGLQSMDIEDDDIGQVVLVGGGAKLFSIFHALEQRFAGKHLLLADNPDECVVEGCSIEYGAATAKVRPSLLFMPDFDINSLKSPVEENPATEKEKLFVLRPMEGDAIPLILGENRVGRTPANEIQLIAEKVSRFHAKLVVSEEAVEAVDLGSTNGTFINEVMLAKNQPVTLKPGDEIQFGDQRFRIEVSS